MGRLTVEINIHEMQRVGLRAIAECSEGMLPSGHQPSSDLPVGNCDVEMISNGYSMAIFSYTIRASSGAGRLCQASGI
jgi:hypothetical protein